MAPGEKKIKRCLGGFVGAVLTVGLGLACFFSPAANLLDSLSYDVPFLLRSEAAGEEAVLVYLDEASHEDLNQPFTAPWDRALHARLINILTTNQAKAIIFDILFSDANTANPVADQQLKAAIQASQRVVLAADYIVAEPAQGLSSEKLALPYDEFAKAAAGWGNAKLLYDYDFAVRRHFPNLTDVGGLDVVPSLAWAAAKFAGAPVTKAQPPLTATRWVNYYGPPGVLPSISYYQVLLPQGSPPNFFRDKVVFVGNKLSADFSGKGKDEFATAHSRWGRGFSPGLEIQATAFLNLLHGDWLTLLPLAAEMFILILAGALLGWGLTCLRPIPAFGVAVGAWALVAGLDLFLVWSAKTWFSWLFVGAIQIPAALVWSWLTSFFHWRVERSLLVESLSVHVPPPRVKELLGHPQLLKPGATERTISILFTDISNFSTITESMLSSDFEKLVNDYFKTALEAIHEHDGTVIKLIGDAIFAVWNAPQDQPDHQELACKAALRLQQQLVRFDKLNKNLPLRTRAGLHTGKAHVGNFGSPRRFDYTAMGDSVNLASRLEGLNKPLGTEILASREFHQKIEGISVDRPLGLFALKGLKHPVQVHEIIGVLGCQESTKPWREAFADGLHKFQRRDFAGAERSFQHVLSLKPGDGPSHFYIQLARLYLDKPPGQEWIGVVEIEQA